MLGKGLTGCLFFASDITYLLELAGQLNISEYIKNWEEGEQLQNGFLCAVLNGDLSFERYELHVEHVETNLLPSCLKGI